MYFKRGWSPCATISYLRTALEEINIPGGEAVSRALSTRGNPTLKTLATLYRALTSSTGITRAA